MSNDWIRAAHFDDVPEDDVIGVSLNNHEYALYKVDGEVFATDNICSHGHARLCDGFLEDGQIECPLHQGRFDIRNGKAMCEPLTEDIRAYPVRVEDGNVFLRVAASE
ncbi:non-heme iron oxygenase ferredoxin subunit [Pseudomonas citronellolis]|uniref:non-heme iron oxygenase ferredoxin subunit n=1 Tax=Pseudomonas citronellolis TaxID=53408 RepID=UPI000853AFC7|nr:non-heme iron oxygenase ferredoxin subunit [Pseudomonas humi]